MGKGSPPAPPPAREPRWAHPLLPALLLGTLVAALYWPALGYDFILYDDGPLVAENPGVLGGLTPEGLREAVSPNPPLGLWVPLTFLSLMADASIFGAGPLGSHLTTVLLFSLGSALFLLVLNRATGSLAGAALGAAFFALHPLRVESVAWVTERKDCLALVFLGLALAVYLRAVRGGGWWFALLALLHLLGLLSKPILVVLPVLLLALDFWPLRRMPAGGPGWLAGWGRLTREKAPLFVLSGSFIAITFWEQGENLFPASLFTRLILAATSPITYLWETAWPFGLHLQSFDPSTVPPWPLGLGAFLLSAVMTMAVIRERARRPWLAAGWFWYLATLAPMAGLFPVGSQWMSDRFTLLPHLGLAVAISGEAAFRAGRGSRGKRAAGALALAVLAGFAMGTRLQLPFWRDSRTLLGRALAFHPGDPMLLNNLGLHRLRGGEADEAAGIILQAVERDPANPDLRRNLGLALSAGSRVGEAITQFREAVRLRPGDAGDRLLLGTALLDGGEPGEALRILAPFTPPAPFLPGRGGPRLLAQGKDQLGRALLRSGRADEAVRQWEEALVLSPGAHLTRLRLAERRWAEGHRDEAVARWQEIVEMAAPAAAEALFAKGRLQALQGRTTQAEGLFRRAANAVPLDRGFAEFVREGAGVGAAPAARPARNPLE